MYIKTQFVTHFYIRSSFIEVAIWNLHRLPLVDLVFFSWTDSFFLVFLVNEEEFLSIMTGDTWEEDVPLNMRSCSHYGLMSKTILCRQVVEFHGFYLTSSVLRVPNAWVNEWVRYSQPHFQMKKLKLWKFFSLFVGNMTTNNTRSMTWIFMRCISEEFVVFEPYKSLIFAQFDFL